MVSIGVALLPFSFICLFTLADIREVLFLHLFWFVSVFIGCSSSEFCFFCCCIFSVFISLFILFYSCLRFFFCISSCSGCVFCCIYVVFLGNISSAVFIFVGVLWFTGMGVSSAYGRLVRGKVGLVLNCESWHIRNYLLNWYRSLGKCFCSLIHWYALVLAVKYLLLCLIPG